MKTSKIRFSFKSKNQAPLFMIIREYYEHKELVYAEPIFELWGYKERKQFKVNIFGNPKISRSCLDGVLTHDCAKCQYWCLGGDDVGCCCPFPIMECVAFAKQSKKADRLDRIKRRFQN